MVQQHADRDAGIREIGVITWMEIFPGRVSLFSSRLKTAIPVKVRDRSQLEHGTVATPGFCVAWFSNPLKAHYKMTPFFATSIRRWNEEADRRALAGRMPTFRRLRSFIARIVENGFFFG